MCLNFPLPTNARALASCWALSVASKHRLKYFFLLLFRTKLKILCTHCCCLLFQTKLKTLCTHCCCHQTCMLAVLFSAWLNVTVMARSTVKYAALFDWVQGGGQPDGTPLVSPGCCLMLLDATNQLTSPDCQHIPGCHSIDVATKHLCAS